MRRTAPWADRRPRDRRAELSHAVDNDEPGNGITVPPAAADAGREIAPP